MYEVTFAPSGDLVATLGNISGLGVDDSTISTAVSMMQARVFNAVGSPPARPAGNRPAYSNGARGPTPAITPFAVDSIGLTFPAQLVVGDVTAASHYLPVEVARLFNALEILYGRRPDLALQATLAVEVRRLFEQNDPGNPDNTASAEKLYSAIDLYPQTLVVYAGGDDTGFNVTLDVLRRPEPVEVENYLGGS